MVWLDKGKLEDLLVIHKFVVCVCVCVEREREENESEYHLRQGFQFQVAWNLTSKRTRV